MRHENIHATVSQAAAMKADVAEHQERIENRKQRRARLSRARKAHRAAAKRRVSP